MKIYQFYVRDRLEIPQVLFICGPRKQVQTPPLPPLIFLKLFLTFSPTPPSPPKFSSSLSQVFKSNFYLFIESKKSIIMLFLPAVVLYGPYLLLQKSFPLGILDYILNNRVSKQSQIQIKWQMTSITPLWALYTYIANSHLNLLFE